MADLFDVESAFAALLTSMLYPPTVTISGSATGGDIVTLTATPQQGNAIIANYTVQISDTPSSIAAGLNTAWLNATGLMSNTPGSVNGAVLTLNVSPGNWNPPPGTWSLTSSVSGSATEIVTIATAPALNQRAPAIAAPVAIGVGWPTPETLDGITAASSAQALISVFPPEGFYRDQTRYDLRWRTLIDAAPTLTATVNSLQTQVTIGGSVSVPQVVAILVGNTPYAYRVLAGDTLNSIAAALAALVNVNTPASASGSVITVASAPELVAQVGAQGTVYREVSRQIERIFIDIWAPSPTLRTSIAKAITPGLARATFITLPDLTSAYVRPCGARDIDNAEKAGLYRRCLMFDVEYATVETQPAQQIVIFEGQQAGGQMALGQSPSANTFI